MRASSRVRGSLLLVVAALFGVACGSSATSAPKTASDAELLMPTAPRVMIAAGFSHSLALGADGRLLAWGDNGSGQLGDGSGSRQDRPVRVALPKGAGKVVAVAAGSTHSIALTADGAVWTWGHNQSGQLGDGSRSDRPTPVHVSGLRDVRSVAAGAGFSLVLEADGSVWAWGNNQSGELGDGKAPSDHRTPEKVYGLGPGSGVTAIAAGESFGLVLKRDGSVWGWGNGTSGQLGDGAATKRSAPTRVVGLGAGSGVVQIAAGGSFSLALKRDGSVSAWGNNASGNLGDGTAPTDHRVPVSVKGLGPGSGVVQVAAGYSFGLALRRDGVVLAWGNNSHGQLGDGKAPNDEHTPVAAAIQVSAP